MPRKKQVVQKQRRRKVYREGELSGEATHIKPKGAFRLFSNYQIFAIIGAVALIGGLALSAVLGGQGQVRNPDGSVRGEGVIRTTPEAGETPTTGATTNIKQYPAAPVMAIDPEKSYVATIKTDKGEIRVELFAKDAPEAVNSFVFLARDGYYDGVTFHRVLPGFVAQTGDPTGTGSGGPGYTIPVENTDDEFVAGTLGMAKPPEAGAPNNGSQFFITLDDQPTLTGKNTVFGRVVEGLEVLEQLTPRDPQNVSNPPPGDRIQSIEITEA